MKTLSPPITVTAVANTLPAWVPAAGFFGNIPFTNGPDDVFNPALATGAANTDSAFSVWNGGVYVPEFSALGAMCYHGAGHGYQLQGIFVADLSALVWSWTNKPTQAWPDSAPPADQYGQFADGSVLAPHTYEGCQRAPVAWSVAGGGSKGNYVHFAFAGSTLKNVGWLFDLNQAQTGNTRICDPLQVKSNPADPAAFAGLYPASALDEQRQGWWVCGSQPVDFGYFVSKAGVPVTQFPSPFINDVNEWCIGRDPVHDLLIAIGQNKVSDPLRILVLDCTNPSAGWTVLTMVGDGSINLNDRAQTLPDYYLFPYHFDPTDFRNNFAKSGAEWSTILGCFILYDDRGPGYWDNAGSIWVSVPNGTAKVWKVTPPTVPLSQPWTISMVTLQSTGGAVLALPSAANGNWSKLREVPLARCFVWTTAHDKAPQALRLPGM